MRNNKATFLLAVLKRTLPMWIAALALGWLLRDLPAIAWGSAKGILPRVRVLQAEGRHRVPPSRTDVLKGTWPTIQWINTHLPREQPLLYVGRMSMGIRLRYYTFPRAGHWHYIYSEKDIARVPETLQASAAATVVVQQFSKLRNYPVPENWREIWVDPKALFRIYEVTDHAGE